MCRTIRSVTGGDSFSVSWKIQGGRTFGHTNVHYDTIDDLTPETCLLRSSCQTSPQQAAGNGSFSATIVAPVVTSPTVYYFGVHAEIDGFDEFSSIIPVLISPASVPHTVTITAGPSGSPNPVSSGAATNLGVTATDSLGHSLTYAWAASCPVALGSNGSFGGSNVQNPTWTAPVNSTGALQNCTVQVTVADGHGLTQVATYQQAVNFSSPNHTITITGGPSGNPNPLIPGATANLSVTAADSLGHALSYSWTASCPNLPSNGTLIGTATRTPSWIAPQNSTGSQQNCTMQVTVTDGLGLGQTGSYTQGVSPGGAASLSVVDGIRFLEPPPYQVSGHTTVDATIKNIGSSTVLLDRVSAVGNFKDGFGFTFDREWPADNFSPPLSLAPGASYRYSKLLTDSFPGVATTATVMMNVKFNNIPGLQTITNFVFPGNAQLAFEVGHTINITNGPGGGPNPVASGSPVTITVNANDTLGHAVIFAWNASCPGLSSNGTFANAAVQNPTWTAPINITGSPQNCTIQLQVSDGQGISNSASYTEVVNSVPHTITFVSDPSGNPNPIGSGGSVNVTASATDSLNHQLSYSWTSTCSTLGSNGTFSNPNVQAPIWTAPVNLTGTQQNCTIQVSVSDGLITPQIRSYVQAVASREHVLSITNGPSGNPNPVSSGGTANWTLSATDSLNHSLIYAWAASCPAVLGSNGSFNNSNMQNPTWTAPVNATGSQQNCTIQVTVSDGQGLSQVGQQILTVNSITRTLTVSSSNPNSGASITVSPNDNSNQGNGTTQFTRTYNNNTPVTLVAAATAGGNNFSSWSGCDSSNGTTCNVTMSADKTVTAVYINGPATWPDSPSNLTAVCSADGTRATLSWDSLNGATAYALRVNNKNNDGPGCVDGWYCSDPPDKILDFYGSTSYVASVTPNQPYAFWVHGLQGNGYGNPGSQSFTCNGGSTQPTVTIAATTPTAVEGGAAGAFTVTRTGSTTSALTVNYTVSGTAVVGTNYTMLTGSVVIPANSSTAVITVTTVENNLVEGDKTVVVTLSANAAYTVGSPNAATVTVVDNDSPPPPPTWPSAPINLVATCSADGTQATLSWSSVNNATSYALRVNNQSNDGPGCIDNWYCSDPPDKILDFYGSTSYVASVTPNQPYDFWVHGLKGSSYGNVGHQGGFVCTPTGTSTHTLTVASSNPNSGASITVSPNDNSNQGSGSTQFTRVYNNNTPVTLTAAAVAGGSNFSSWSGCDSSNGTTCNVSMSGDKTVTAVYVPQTWTFCANENEFCSFTGTKLVRYGAGTSFNQQTATNGISCDNATFGDPIFGTFKHCDYTDASTQTAGIGP